MAPDRLPPTFRQLTAEAGLPPVRLRDLRHGAATLAQGRTYGGAEVGSMLFVDL